MLWHELVYSPSIDRPHVWCCAVLHVTDTGKFPLNRRICPHLELRHNRPPISTSNGLAALLNYFPTVSKVPALIMSFISAFFASHRRLLLPTLLVPSTFLPRKVIFSLFTSKLCYTIGRSSFFPIPIHWSMLRATQVSLDVSWYFVLWYRWIFSFWKQQNNNSGCYDTYCNQL